MELKNGQQPSGGPAAVSTPGLTLVESIFISLKSFTTKRFIARGLTVPKLDKCWSLTYLFPPYLSLLPPSFIKDMQWYPSSFKQIEYFVFRLFCKENDGQEWHTSEGEIKGSAYKVLACLLPPIWESSLSICPLLLATLFLVLSIPPPSLSCPLRILLQNHCLNFDLSFLVFSRKGSACTPSSSVYVNVAMDISHRDGWLNNHGWCCIRNAHIYVDMCPFSALACRISVGLKLI